MAALRYVKIIFPAANEWDTIFIISVDGTHYQINEPRDPNVRKNPKWYSHKFHLAGLNYEIAISLWDSKIVHASCWDPASTHDKTVFRRDLLHKIPAGKRVIADKGYIANDLSEILSIPNQFDSEQLKDFKARARARHETINDRLKKYNVMKHKFRHGVKKAQMCFDACLVNVQYAIEDTGKNGEPLFDL